MKKSKSDITSYTTEYIHEVFEVRLCEEGFVCPDDKLLCWYRLKGDEVFDSVIFRAQWPNLPLMIEILYESSPLFFAPLRIPNVQHNDSTHMRLDCRYHTANLESGSLNAANFALFAPQIPVMAPAYGGRGVYSFDEVILPKLNRIRSIEDCYAWHKEEYIKTITAFTPMDKTMWYMSSSREFVAEAVLQQDTDIYPNLCRRVEKAIGMYERLATRKPSDGELATILEEWKILEVVLFDGDRETFLKSIEQRNRHTIKQFTKWGVLPK